MLLSPYDNALRRLESQTLLPKWRVRTVLDVAIGKVKAAVVGATGVVEPMERAIMLATTILWAEEKSSGLSGARTAGAGGGGTADTHARTRLAAQVPKERRIVEDACVPQSRAKRLQRDGGSK